MNDTKCEVLYIVLCYHLTSSEDLLCNYSWATYGFLSLVCVLISRIPAGDEVRKHTVVFSVSATFVFKDEQKLKGYTPPPPPGLLTVPYDVFYPFIGNSAFAGQQGLITVTHVAIGISVFCFTYFIF